ncbi:MAG: hypothetical protein ACK5Q5_01180 [Planctomycetaceae bacterium]
MLGQLTTAHPTGRWWVVGGTPPYKGGCPTTTAPCRDWWDVPPRPGIPGMLVGQFVPAGLSHRPGAPHVKRRALDW